MEIDVSNYDCLKFAYSSIYFRYYTHSPASYSTSLSNNNNDHSIRYKWITRELFMFLWQCLKVLANCNCSCPSKGTDDKGSARVSTCYRRPQWMMWVGVWIYCEWLCESLPIFGGCPWWCFLSLSHGKKNDNTMKGVCGCWWWWRSDASEWQEEDCDKLLEAAAEEE